jgi:FkbM family methyltransferase
VRMSPKLRTDAGAQRFLTDVFRGPRLQPLWQRVHAVALMGMNFLDANQATNGELWLLDWLAERLDRSPVVFDVGANVGQYSQAVIERLPSAQLYAFEPSAAAFGKLEATLGGHGAAFQLALGAEDAERPLYADGPGSELGSLVRRDLHRHGLDVRETETVTVRRLETLCNELAVERIDLLKIDAEGSELDVLGGAGAMLGERVGVIQFEFGGTAIDARRIMRDFFDILEPEYRIYRLLPGGLWPLRYSESIEILVYANYVALPRSASQIGELAGR